jgi:hypothetical protein
VVHLRIKDSTEFNGPESYVSQMVLQANLDWFPRMRTRALEADAVDEDDSEMRLMRAQLTVRDVYECTSESDSVMMMMMMMMM